MASTADCVRILIEESPRYEGAPATAPYRVSSDAAYLPIRAARLTPGPQMLDRGDELRGIEGSVPMLADTFEPGGSIGVRAYMNLLTWLLTIAGFSGSVTAGGASTYGGPDTFTTGSHTLPQATINVEDTSLLPSAGTVLIGTEEVTYTGKTATTLTGATGGTGTITAGTPVAQPIPTGAQRWVFTKRGGTVAKTAQLDFVHLDEGVFLRGQGYGITSLALNAAGEITADLAGLVFANLSVDPNITPAYDSASIDPARRGNLWVRWLGGGGELEDFSLTITNPLERDYTLGQALPSKFPRHLFHGDERVRVTGSVPKKVLADADIDALLAAETFRALARWQSDAEIATSGFPYTLWIDMPACQYTGGQPGEHGNRRRIGSELDFWAAWDETLGYDVRIILANSVSAVETYA